MAAPAPGEGINMVAAGGAAGARQGARGGGAGQGARHPRTLTQAEHQGPWLDVHDNTENHDKTSSKMASKVIDDANARRLMQMGLDRQECMEYCITPEFCSPNETITKKNEVIIAKINTIGAWRRKWFECKVVHGNKRKHGEY